MKIYIVKNCYGRYWKKHPTKYYTNKKCLDKEWTKLICRYNKYLIINQSLPKPEVYYADDITPLQQINYP